MNTRELFPIVVVGHVDHGKSTVIGRLLADTGSLPEGKLDQVKATCARNSKPFEYAFLLDALKNEQSQGITIDTARCFFKSPFRDYIIIDAPGHIEFLKNMITGASRADAALLIIDAKEGVQENSRRHGYMLSLLGINQVVVCVNKMDLAGYSEGVFQSIKNEYTNFLNELGVVPREFVPMAAFLGENLLVPSAQMNWYKGLPLLPLMDQLQKDRDSGSKPSRFPVQDIYKFTEKGDDRRITAGRVESGAFAPGDSVVFYPSGKKAKIKTIEEFGRAPRERVYSGLSTGFTLEPELYIKPGEVMAKAGEIQPFTGRRFRANLFWMGRKPLVKGKRYKLKLSTAEVPVYLDEILGVLDGSELTKEMKSQIELHDVGEVILETLYPIAFDLNGDIPQTGRFVIVDGYEIAGGGIILESQGNEAHLLAHHAAIRDRAWERSQLTTDIRTRRYNQTPTLILLTGSNNQSLSDLGKALEENLFAAGRVVYYLGFSNALSGLEAGLDPHSQRDEILRRLSEVSHLFTDAGLLVIASVPDLEEAELEMIRTLTQPAPILVAALGESLLNETSVSLNLTVGERTGSQVLRALSYLATEQVILEYNL